MQCCPVVEIRDSQASASKVNLTFGDNGLSMHSAPQQPPAEQFNMGTRNINVDMNSASFNYLANADSPSYSLPNRQRATQYSMSRVSNLGDSLSPPGSDSAQSPGMHHDRGSTRSNSYKDSSSHASFTPPSITDSADTQPQRQDSVDSRPSPHTVGSTSSIPTPSFNGTGAGRSILEDNGNFFTGMDTNFSSFQPGFLGQPIDATNNFAMTGWDMPGIEITTGGTGMTPLSTDWNQMLDEIGPWDSTGDNNSFLPRGVNDRRAS